MKKQSLTAPHFLLLLWVWRRYAAWRDPPEEHKVHGFFAEVVELLQVPLSNDPQLLQVTHLHVVLGIRLGVRKVTVDETANVILHNLAIIVKVKVGKQLIKVFSHLLFDNTTSAVEQPVTVSIINQTVVEDTEHLNNTYKTKQKFFLKTNCMPHSQQQMQNKAGPISCTLWLQLQRIKHIKGSKESYSLGQKHNLQIFRVIPFVRLQNSNFIIVLEQILKIVLEY